MRPCAAGGRFSKAAISAAVEKCEDQRKPDAFFGHRKADGRPQTTLDDVPANFLRHYQQYKNGAFDLICRGQRLRNPYVIRLTRLPDL